MNSLFPVICLIVFFIPGYSQNYYSEFSRHFQSNDTLKSREVLENWEKASPNDAELYTCWFNYYFKTAKKDYLTITQDTPEGEAFEISDTTGKPVGYMVGQVYYDSLTLQKGLDKIDEGIALFPDRLDMRFGKTYAYGQVKYWDQFRDEIIKTVRYSGENNNEWTWTFNVKKEGGSEFFLKALQDYQVQIYNTGENELLPYMREVAEEVLRLYPEHVESLTNLAITYLLEDEYEKGLESLLKAEKLRPDDTVILANIAQSYQLMGDVQKALEYYYKLIETGDEKTKAYALKQIEELEK